MQDRADPHARDRAFDIADRIHRWLSPDEAAAEIREVLESIGDSCRSPLLALRFPCS